MKSESEDVQQKHWELDQIHMILNGFGASLAPVASGENSLGMILRFSDRGFILVPVL